MMKKSMCKHSDTNQSELHTIYISNVQNHLVPRGGYVCTRRPLWPIGTFLYKLYADTAPIHHWIAEIPNYLSTGGIQQRARDPNPSFVIHMYNTLHLFVEKTACISADPPWSCKLVELVSWWDANLKMRGHMASILSPSAALGGLPNFAEYSPPGLRHFDVCIPHPPTRSLLLLTVVEVGRRQRDPASGASVWHPPSSTTITNTRHIGRAATLAYIWQNNKPLGVSTQPHAPFLKCPGPKGHVNSPAGAYTGRA